MGGGSSFGVKPSGFSFFIYFLSTFGLALSHLSDHELPLAMFGSTGFTHIWAKAVDIFSKFLLCTDMGNKAPVIRPRPLLHPLPSLQFSDPS